MPLYSCSFVAIDFSIRKGNHKVRYQVYPPNGHPSPPLVHADDLNTERLCPKRKKKRSFGTYTPRIKEYSHRPQTTRCPRHSDPTSAPDPASASSFSSPTSPGSALPPSTRALMTSCSVATTQDSAPRTFALHYHLLYSA